MNLYNVTLNSIELFGHHGVLEEEKKDGQSFYIDIQYAYTKNSLKDDIEEALDYSKVYSVAKKVFESKNYELLESLACDISKKILVRFSQIESIDVAVRKVNPPIGGKARFVSVSIKAKK